MKKIILKVWLDQVIHFWLYPYQEKLHSSITKLDPNPDLEILK